MNSLEQDAAEFRRRASLDITQAAQRAALSLICGLDLPDALSADPETLKRYLGRLRRAIERERLKGAARHWSYDLNRHIALKQVLDRLCAPAMAADGKPTDHRQKWKRRRRGAAS